MLKCLRFTISFSFLFLLPAGNRIITATKVIQEVIQECFDFKLWSYGPQMTASLLSLSHYSSLVLCTQMCTLGYEWAFVRLLNRPLCHVSRLIHLPWKKKPLIPFPSIWNSMYFCVMQILQLSAVTGYSCSILFLKAHFCSDKMEQGMKKWIEASVPPLSIWYCTFKQEVRLSSDPMYYDLISIQISSVDFLWFSCELLSHYKSQRASGWAQWVAFRIEAFYTVCQFTTCPL